MMPRILVVVLAVVACREAEPIDHVILSDKHFKKATALLCHGLDFVDHVSSIDWGMPIGRRGITRERCFIKGADQQNAGLLDIELRGDSKAPDFEPYHCFLQFGPNAISRPVDFSRLFDAIEHEKLRSQLVALMSGVSNTASMEVNAIFEGNIHVYIRQRPSEVHGPDLWIRIDGCGRPPGVQPQGQQVSIYSDAFNRPHALPPYTGN